jgi:hypothetical protein
MPAAASRSMCGVSWKVLPWQPRSVWPRSSTRTTITFGFSAALRGALTSNEVRTATSHQRGAFMGRFCLVVR